MQRVEEEQGGGGGTTRAPRSARRCSIASVPASAGDTGDTRTPRGSRHASLDSTAQTQVCPTGQLPLHSLLPAQEPPAVPQIICSSTPGPELLLPIARHGNGRPPG